MKSRLVYSVVGLLLLAGPVSAEAPLTRPAKEKVDWYAIESSLSETLLKKDLLDWSNELFKKLDSADAPTLITAMEVFIRAGQPQRVSKVIPLIVKNSDKIDVFDRCVVGRLLSAGFYEQAKMWFETPFPLYVIRNDTEPFFIAWMKRKYGSEVMEAWLKTQYVKEQKWTPLPKDVQSLGEYKLGPRGLLFWDTLRQTNRQKLKIELDSLRDEYKKNPDVSGLPLLPICKFLRVWNMEQGRVMTEWMFDAIRLEHALDNFVIAQKQSSFDAKMAIHFYKRSLASPLTDYDQKQIRHILPSLPPGGNPPSVEKLRQWAKVGLAGVYLREGREEKAQVLFEEVGGKKTVSWESLAAFRLEAEYPHIRAVSYIGDSPPTSSKAIFDRLKQAEKHIEKKEFKQAEENYKAALASPTNEHHDDIVNCYVVFLVEQKRQEEAEALCRRELQRASMEKTYRILHDLNELQRNRGCALKWDEPAIWAALEKQKKSQKCFYYGPDWLRKVAHATPPQDWEAFKRKGLTLIAKPCSPDLQFAFGNILYKHKKSQEAAKIMKMGFDHYTGGSEISFNDMADTTFRALLEQGDVRAADDVLGKLLDDKESGYDFGMDYQWLGRLAAVAAQNNAPDLAIVLWKRKIRFNLTDLEGLDKIVGTKTQARFLQLYKNLSRKDPGNMAIARAVAVLEGKLKLPLKDEL